MTHTQALTVSLAGLLCIVPRSPGETVTILSSQDTTLYESALGLLGNGTGSQLFAGRSLQVANSVRRTLIAFDVAAQIPPGSSIDSVTLVMFMSRTRSGASQAVELHRVLVGWGEGNSNAIGQEGAGASATPGDATWVHTFFDGSFWATPGGDFATTASAALPIFSIGPYTWGPSLEMTSDVQEWLDTPASNHGWILVGNESSSATVFRFASRENEVVDRQPVLIVEFTQPALGACCDGAIGSCDDGVLERDCICDQCVWTSDIACVDAAPCAAATGACCDPSGSLGAHVENCVPDLSEADCLACEGGSCSWFEGESCADVTLRGDCPLCCDAVPATSTWHMIFAALFTLVVAKIRGAKTGVGTGLLRS